MPKDLKKLNAALSQLDRELDEIAEGTRKYPSILLNGFGDRQYRYQMDAKEKGRKSEKITKYLQKDTSKYEKMA